MDPQKLLSADLLTIFGLENAPEDSKSTFLTEATHLVLAKVAERIESELPPEKKAEFTSLFSASDHEEDQVRFLDAHVPDFEEIVVQETLLFKAMMQTVSEEAAEQKI